MCALVDRTFPLSEALWTNVRFKPKLFRCRINTVEIRKGRGHGVNLVQSPDIPLTHPSIGAFHNEKSVLTFYSKAVSIEAEPQEWDNRWWG